MGVAPVGGVFGFDHRMMGRKKGEALTNPTAFLNITVSCRELRSRLMTKSVLIDKLAEKVDDLTSSQTETVLDTILESMKNALIKGDRVEIRGFGVFWLKTRKPRQARNEVRWIS